jgi:ABC-type phosphate/phosphonate transport system substrate-binding protein
MTIKVGVMAVALLALAAGCAQSNNDDNDDQDQPEESVKNVWSGQAGTIDKAKGVEQTLMQSALQQNGEIDSQSR